MLFTCLLLPDTSFPYTKQWAGFSVPDLTRGPRPGARTVRSACTVPDVVWFLLPFLLNTGIQNSTSPSTALFPGLCRV